MTADDAAEVVMMMAEIVEDLDEESGDQNVDNLGIIAGIYGQVNGLVTSSQINVTNNVSSSQTAAFRELILPPLIISS